jgi:hypothetical protein
MSDLDRPYAVAVQAAESPLGRSLWVVTLSITIAIAIFSFARQPLFGSDGTAAAFGQPLELWIAGSDAGGQAELVARQAAGWLGVGAQAGVVGVLPGGSSSAVASFLDRVHHNSSDLLVITSTTLADIARDDALPEASELRLRAQRAGQLLARTAPIAVLSSDPLALAVPSESPVHDTAQLRALDAAQSARPLFSVADDSWLTDNLAALAESSGLSGPTPYSQFSSPGEAALGLDSGAGEAVLAPRSTIASQLRTHRLRELRWPTATGQAPRAWVAIVAAPGLASGTLARLRGRARRLCASATWRSVLRRDGLSPEVLSTPGLRSFIRVNTGQTARLQALSGRIVRD